MPEHATYIDQKCSGCACNTFGLIFVALLHRKRCSWILSIAREILLDIMLFYFHNYSVLVPPPPSLTFNPSQFPISFQCTVVYSVNTIHPPRALKKERNFIIYCNFSCKMILRCGINVVLVCCGECSRLNGWASCCWMLCRSFESTTFIQQNLFAFECGRNILQEHHHILFGYIFIWCAVSACVCLLRYTTPRYHINK